MLIGCYSLALYAYRWERNLSGKISFALLLPTLWMMRCASRGIDNWNLISSPVRLDPILVATLIVLGFFVLSKRNINWSDFIGKNFAFVLFYAWICLSVTWATELEDPVVKLFRPICDLTMAMIIATEKDPLKSTLSMFRRTAILLIPVSILLFKYYPDLGRMTAKNWNSDNWVGVSTHKNPLGQLCIVSAIGFMFTYFHLRAAGATLRHQFIPLLYLLMTAYILNGSGHSRSSTSVTCLALAIMLFYYTHRLKANPQLAASNFVKVTILAGIFAGLLVIFDTSPQALVAQIQGKDPTLTDRTFLWDDVKRITGENFPFTGAGYDGFFTTKYTSQFSGRVDNRPQQSHNGYLEVYANLGIVGLILLFFMIISALKNSLNGFKFDYDYHRFRFVILIMVVTMNYAEATFPRGTHLWWFGFLAIALSPPQQTRQIEQPQPNQSG